MPLIRCQHCGKSSFAFARRPYIAHCAECGKPLNGRQDTAAIESQIRERLYGPRFRAGQTRVTRPGVAARG